MIQAIHEICFLCFLALTSSFHVLFCLILNILRVHHIHSHLQEVQGFILFYSDLANIFPWLKVSPVLLTQDLFKNPSSEKLTWLASKEAKLLSAMHNWMINRGIIVSKVNLISSLFMFLILWFQPPQISTEIPCVSISHSFHTYQVQFLSVPKGKHIVLHHGS